MADIFGVKPNKVSIDILQYALMLTGETGVGKTTTMYKILTQASNDGRSPLFLMFEDRYQHIDGIMAVKINSVSDFKSVILQLKNPDAKKIFSCVVLDTIDKYEEMMEVYTINKKSNAEILKDLGAFGEGTQRYRTKLRYIQEIKNLGFPVHFIAQGVTDTDISNKANPNLKIHTLKINKNTKRYISDDISMLGYIFVGENNQRFITFENSYGNQTAFGDNDEISYLKKSFNVPVAIPVEEFNETLISAIKNNNSNITEENTLQPRIKKYSFNELKDKGIELGNNLIEAGYSEEVMNICNEHLPQDTQFNDLVEIQYDICEVIVTMLEDLSIEKGLAE